MVQVMQFIKRRRQRGGQFIAFRGSEDDNKPTWRKCNKMEIVQQLMEAADGTDSTAQMSSAALLDSDNESVSSSEDAQPKKRSPAVANKNKKEQQPDAKVLAAERRPTWLKRPMFADICGNHAMVNAERQWGNPNLHPLKRSRELDDLARAHAEEMACASMAYHADPTDLLSKLKTRPNIRLGENVAKGECLRDLHNEMKKKASNYANMMDNRYSEFGIGTARDVNGDLFLCQIYRG